MPSPMHIMPFQMDLKTKGSGIGGFTDGGVKCIRRDLNDPVSFIAKPFVDVGPEPGRAWRSIVMSPRANESSSIVVANFGTHSVDVDEKTVLEDGTVLDTLGVNTFPGNVPGVLSFALDMLGLSIFAGSTVGGILSYPNKVRYTLHPLNSTPSTPLAPNGRVMLMMLVQELDLLKDE